MKNILVTGANRGIGLELVRQLAAGPATAQIFATCRKPSDAKELAEIQSNSKQVKIHILPLDVTINSQVESTVKSVQDAVGNDGLNVLINNAGLLNKEAHKSQFPTIDMDELNSHFAINTNGPIMMSQALLPLLEKAAQKSPGSGMSCSKSAIINLTSELGSLEMTHSMMHPMSPYKISKAALNMAMKIISIEVKPKEILVGMISPGWVKTDMGGEKAEITVQHSISSILKLMASFSDKDHGGFYNYDGQILPW